MAPVLDIILLDNFDLEIQNGDFVIDESTAQHINHILIANKGDYKAAPRLGADVQRLLNDEASPNEVKADIQEELERDGLKIKEIEITDKINIIAQYEQ